MLILVDATFAWSVGADFPVIIRYRLSHQGIVAMVHPDGFLTVHIPLLNMTAQLASSNRLMEINVKAISGVYTTFFSIALVYFDPFGSSICTSPIPIALRV